jgi:hypothetical protein
MDPVWGEDGWGSLGRFLWFWGGAAACFWCFSVSVLLLMLGLSVFWCVRCLACLVAESENKVTTNLLIIKFSQARLSKYFQQSPALK